MSDKDKTSFGEMALMVIGIALLKAFGIGGAIGGGLGALLGAGAGSLVYKFFASGSKAP
jgi:hypothetical protein